MKPPTYGRLLVALLLGISLIISLPACAPKTMLTTEGRTAYTADQVVIRVNELQNAAIQANAGGSLPDATTRLIVQFAVSADTTLKAAPLGWQATVLKAWDATKKQLPKNLPASITTGIAALDTVLGVLGGQ